MKGSKKSLSLRKVKAQSFGKQMVALFVYRFTPIFTPTFWGSVSIVDSSSVVMVSICQSVLSGS